MTNFSYCIEYNQRLNMIKIKKSGRQAYNSCFAKVAVWFSKETFFYIWNSVSQRRFVQDYCHLRKATDR